VRYRNITHPSCVGDAARCPNTIHRIGVTLC
jgi:hypothetical protein